MADDRPPYPVVTRKFASLPTGRILNDAAFFLAAISWHIQQRFLLANSLPVEPNHYGVLPSNV
jgi:hypothetical protein